MPIFSFRTVRALLTNTGQVCFAATRVYVQSGIYDAFFEAYAKAIEDKKKTIGDPEKKGTEIGPVVDKAQFERIMGILNTAKAEKQGTLHSGGGQLGSEVRQNDFLGISWIYEADKGHDVAFPDVD